MHVLAPDTGILAMPGQAPLKIGAGAGFSIQIHQIERAVLLLYPITAVFQWFDAVFAAHLLGGKPPFVVFLNAVVHRCAPSLFIISRSARQTNMHLPLARSMTGAMLFCYNSGGESGTRACRSMPLMHSSLFAKVSIRKRMAQAVLPRRDVRLVLLGVLLSALSLFPGACTAAEPLQILLGERLRPGWTASTSRQLTLRSEDGVIAALPNDRTRDFAQLTLTGKPGAAVDARACSQFRFEINTLPGANGKHRAPQLRVGVSDASGRSRQPLLADFARLDTDPTTWQEVIIPLDHLLDRGVSAKAITLVSWQFSGPAAPFAVRRVAFTGSATAGYPAYRSGNLLADPGFETRLDARPLWPLIGDYRAPAEHPEDYSLVSGDAVEGKRYLRLAMSRPYTFEALAPPAATAGFSLALRAARSSRVEIGCAVVGFGRQGKISIGGRATRIVNSAPGWQRFALSIAVDSNRLPSDDGEFVLYRAWVRPIKMKTPLDVDAVMLAAAPVDAARYSPQETNLLAAGSGVFRRVRSLLEYRPLTEEYDSPLPAHFQSELPPLHIPLAVREWAGRSWDPALISGGVPLPRGALFSPDVLRLRAPDGREIPFQFEVLRRDTRDGSVRCLWLAFAAVLGAGQHASYTLETGSPHAAPLPVLATEDAAGILVDTGVFRARIPRDRFPLFTEAAWSTGRFHGATGSLRLELLDGTVLTSQAPPSRVAIERNGPFNAVISVQGALTRAGGTPAPRFLYDMRLRAWKGTPGLTIDVALTNLNPLQTTPIRSISLAIPLGAHSAAEASLGREDGSPFTAALQSGETLRLTQCRLQSGSGAGTLTLETPGAQPVTTVGRAAGWCRWQAPGNPAVLLAFKQMADRHPAALAVRPDELEASLYPPTNAKVCLFPFGHTAYGEFWIGSGEDPEAAMARLEYPPLLSAEPSEIAAADMFGSFLPTAEWRQRFKLPAQIRDRKRKQQDGEEEYCSSTAAWPADGNSGSVTDVESLYRHYLSDGDPLIWAQARRALLCLRESETWWSNESSAFPGPHAADTPPQYFPDMSTAEVSGLLTDYWLTGDRRSLETADALGASLLLRIGYARHRAAARAQLLFNLAALYGATGRSIYRQKCEILLDGPLPDAPDRATAALTLCALGECREVLPSAVADAPLRQAITLFQKACRQNQPLTQPESDWFFKALDYLPTEALPTESWNSLLEQMLWFSFNPRAHYAALPDLYQSLPQAAALPAWAAGNPLGLSPYSGRGCKFSLRIKRHGSEPVSFTLCRQRYAMPDMPCAVSMWLRDPLGKQLESARFVDRHAPVQSFNLPRSGVTGDYLLTLTGDEDGLVEVLSAFPHLFLRADEWKRSQSPRGHSCFYLRAPQQGTLALQLRGRPTALGDNQASVKLYALDGTLLCRAGWTAPLMDGTALSPDTTLPLVLSPAYRGQILRLEITTPQGMDWRLQGLSEPWLGATPAAFAP